MTIVRKLNEIGIARFSEYVKRTAAGEALDPPRHLLTDEETSEALLGTAEVDHVVLDKKLHAAKYLAMKLAPLDKSEVDNSSGLWTWLSLYFFDQLCPAKSSGQRKPGELVRHVLSPHAHKYYRHLLAGPYRLFQIHGENARIFLHGTLPEHGDFSEQLASRMQFISNTSLIEAVDHLYFAPSADGGRPKRGAATRGRAGNLRRLITFLQQVDCTYDLYSMNSGQIVSMLPKEFAHFARGSGSDHQRELPLLDAS